ncbi:NAD(P)H-dependent oxidoreductase [Paeniglutamicibacter antarcticus]|uniref:NAD(P)H-dependent oxidoreductase n=1 Tax=Arthrobacter terrae TaxID=2935737 RepID=A0A931CJG8_9MICC|nr:CE1759 family FMN reductase [Arthrobacter terrae]MBG0739732.1 NAD(P)H-dependent oxidoreductase [Arthrobacter terrae]
MQRKIVVISAGLSVPSSTRMLADQLSHATSRQLAVLGIDAEITVVELRDLAVDIAQNFVTGFAPPALAAAIAQVTDADGLIAVTPVFSASYSGLFRSFFDLLDPKALVGMPVISGATGGSTRHSLVLDFAVRPLLSYFRARTMPTAVYAAPEDWGAGDPLVAGGKAVAGLDVRVNQAAKELAAAMGEGLMSLPTEITAHGLGSDDLPTARNVQRARHEAEMTQSLPFEQLLAQISPR